MNIKTLKIIIIPFLLAVMLGGTYLMPRRGEVQDSSISMDLPTGMNPYGWHGTRRQESEQERGHPGPGYGIFQSGLRAGTPHQSGCDGNRTRSVPRFHREIRS